MSIQNKQQMESLLANNGIDTSAWGQGSAKSVADLWNEIASGDSLLQDDPLFRIVSVVGIIIRNADGQVLTEVEQELADGRLRTRNLAPAEKMRPAEDYIGAAIRCLQEELGIGKERVSFLKSTYERVEEMQNSHSYPGLQTKYVYHSIEARIKGLPNTDFWTPEAFHSDKDAVRRHHWAWVKENTAA